MVGGVSIGSKWVRRSPTSLRRVFRRFFLSAGFIESMGSFSGFFLLFFFRVGEKDFTGFYRVLLGWPGRLAAG